jgi:hypothetical protein
MNEETGDKDSDRNEDRRNAEGVTEPIDGMLVAGGVLGDPLLVAASA